MTEQRPVFSWQDLEQKIAPEILSAPKTGGDRNGTWPPVHGRIVRYLFRHVANTLWADHLALVAAVLSARRRDVATVEAIIQEIHRLLSALFPALGLKTMAEWDADRYLASYIKGEVVPHHSQSTRQRSLKRYTSGSRQVWNWLETLPHAERQTYQRFAFPVINPLRYEELSQEKEILQQQQAHRKAETEALVPHFAQLRAESHYRYNRLARLRFAYQQALGEVLPDHSNLPLEFSYEEGDPAQERLSFKLWDRRSFVLHPEHSIWYSPSNISSARRGTVQFSDEGNQVFLEFVTAERISGDAPAEGLWFTDLLRLSLLGAKARQGNEQIIAVKQAWCHQWGYGEEHSEGRVAPFSTKCPGLLVWPNTPASRCGGNGRFIAQAQLRTDKVFIPVEELYCGATFGLLALDLLTTTGMRSNELYQINLLPECLIRLVDDPPPGARDQSPRIRYVLRLLPKGERTETRHNYGIGKETVRLIEKTAHMLCTHYHLQPGEQLPRVAFYPHHHRSHRFEQEKAPYLFQYNYQHLSGEDITACLRFLLHGMVFQTRENAPVVIKPHLLRHAFATFAVHVEGLPIDLVAKWLQQKNLDVTGYYSEMPEYMQVEQHASFVARLATQINVREAIVRSPEEIQKQAEAARKRVGMLVPVCGGDCTLDVYCPNQFDCIHCPAKSPDPEKRHQVEEKKHWAQERLVYYEREGLVLEAEKMRQLLRGCDLELHEMEMIVAYRKDETRVIQIEPRPKRPS